MVEKIQFAINKELAKIGNLDRQSITATSEYIPAEKIFRITIYFDGKSPSIIDDPNPGDLLVMIKYGLSMFVDIKTRGKKKKKEA